MKRKIAAAMAATAMVLVSASSCDSTDSKSAQQSGQELTESSFAQQQAAVPYPAAAMRNSLERANLRDRLIRLNTASKVGYVYLMNFGKIVGYYVIRGKVSNTDSQMTTTDLIERHADTGGGNITVPAPGDDGSYGVNESGNFFFTAENVLVETDLNYLYSDAPLAVDAPKLNAGPPSK